MIEGPSAEQVTAKIAELFPGKEIVLFRPVAYFDKHMDCIRVELRDCSVKELRIDSLLTIHLDTNVTRENEVVGLTIKGVKHLFTEHGIPLEGIVRLTKVLDVISRVAPELIVAAGNRLAATQAVSKLRDFARLTDLRINMSANSSELALAA